MSRLPPLREGQPTALRFARRFLSLLTFVCLVSQGQGAGLVAGWPAVSSGTAVPHDLTNAIAIAVGDQAGLAIRENRSVATWGSSSWIPLQAFSNVVAVAVGQWHALALLANGKVVAAGNDPAGATIVPSNLADVVAIAAGSYHNLALRSDGVVVAWGSNAYGQTDVPVGLRDVSGIAAGANHSLAMRSDGTVISWGQRLNGILDVPADLTGVGSIAAGRDFSLALRTNGTVVAWGAGSVGQTNVPAGLSNVVMISAGVRHSLALRSDGSVVTWGIPLTMPADLPPASAIAAGLDLSLAIVAEGPPRILRNPEGAETVPQASISFFVEATGPEPSEFQWRRDGNPLEWVSDRRLRGQTTDTLTITNLNPADTADYTVQVRNRYGSVMSATAHLTVVSPPVFISTSPDKTVGVGSDVLVWANAEGTPPLSYRWFLNGTTPADGTGSWMNLTNVQLAQGGVYSFIASNRYGEARSAEISITVTNSVPCIPYPTVPRQLPLGGSGTLRVDARGSLPLRYQWRFNGTNLPGATGSTVVLEHARYDQTGYYSVSVSNDLGVTVSPKLPLSVVQAYVWDRGDYDSPPYETAEGLTNLVAVAGGLYHAIALKADGTLAAWLPTAGGSSFKYIPANLSDIVSLCAMGRSNGVVRSDGTVAIWGSGNTPTQAPGLSNIVALSMGDGYVAALRGDGTVVCWGQNNYGQTNVPPGLSNILSISASAGIAIALRSDGRLFGWGYNKLLPPPELDDVIAVSAGLNQNLALLKNGTVAMWNAYDNGRNNGLNLQIGLTNIVAVAADPGSFLHLALAADGTVIRCTRDFQHLRTYPLNALAIARGEGFSVALIGDGSPALTVQPFSRQIEPGTAIELHARVVGVQPMSYQWQFNDQLIANATNADLALNEVRWADTGSYRLMATNARGSVTSTVARVQFLAGPALTQALGSQEIIWRNGSTNASWFGQGAVHHDGEAAAQSGRIGNRKTSVLETSVIGPGTLRYWWRVSCEEGYDFLRFLVDDQATNTAPSLTGEVDWQERVILLPAGHHILRWIYEKDASVAVGEDAGWVDEVRFLPDPPEITLSPLQQTAGVGVEVTFRVDATGGPPLTFQWRRSGVELVGATNSTLILSKVSRRDRGVYSVTVENPGGRVLSPNATLEVRVPQFMGIASTTAEGIVELHSIDVDGGGPMLEDLANLEVQVSTNLVDWQKLPTGLSLTNGRVLILDASAASAPFQFYRVLER